MDLNELKNRIQEEVSARSYLGRAYLFCSLLRRTQEGESAFMQRKGAAKQLCDEMVPIGHFCAHIFKDSPSDVKIRLVLGSQAHDAVVSGPEVHRLGIAYIEVTSIEDESEHKERVEILTKGFTSKEGLLSDVIQHRAELLDRVIKKKSEKYYPTGTALIIYSKETIHPADWKVLSDDISAETISSLKKFRLACILDPKKIQIIHDPISVGKAK